ncbi:MAG: DUF2889 domain-containing protein [Janthinobacterium lividum]
MTLPVAAPRRQVHTRQVVFSGFLRDDGLWDIEAELRDTKPYASQDRERGMLEPGQPFHLMRARLSVDNDFIVHALNFEMAEVPFQYCESADPDFSSMIGMSVGRGWKQALDARIGGNKGCAHLRELMYGLSTAAFQTISPYREQFMPELGAPVSPRTGAPFFLDGCYTWKRSSPVVMTYYPEFAQAADDVAGKTSDASTQG